MKQELLHRDYRKSSLVRKYLSFYSGYKWFAPVELFFFILRHCPVWIMPVATANILNALTNADMSPEAKMHTLVVNSLICAVALVQNIPSHMLFSWVFSIVNRKVERELRYNLCRRFQMLAISYHQNKKMGALQSKVMRDVENVEMLTRLLVESMPMLLLTILVSIGVTAVRTPMFLIFYLATIPVAVGITRFFRKRINVVNSDFRNEIEGVSGRVVEMLRMITVTRAHSVENTELQQVDDRFSSIQKIGRKMDLVTALFNCTNWVVFMIFNLLTLTVAVWLSLTGRINLPVGDITLLVTYFNTITGSVSGFLGTMPAFAKGMASVESVCEVLECPDIEQNRGKPEVKPVKGDFEFEHVTFRYESGDENALTDFNFSVRHGETIALVGHSGSGKSTLMQLLIGFIRPVSGRILIDGCDMNDIDLRTYRHYISVVSQETILFDGSIGSNITYGAASATPKQLETVVKGADLEQFIASLPDGINTRIKENGARLSGGQKQRIAIARALLRDPQILLLDEATSALDVESEASIQSALNHLIQGRTTFIVAHRLSTIRNADRIVVLEHGKIVEIGTHSELLAKQGAYYRLNRIQNGFLAGNEPVQA